MAKIIKTTLKAKPKGKTKLKAKPIIPIKLKAKPKRQRIIRDGRNGTEVVGGIIFGEGLNRQFKRLRNSNIFDFINIFDRRRTKKNKKILNL